MTDYPIQRIVKPTSLASSQEAPDSPTVDGRRCSITPLDNAVTPKMFLDARPIGLRS